METETRRITPEIEGELLVIQDFLETRHSDEPTVLAQVLAEINVQMARTGYLLAEAKYDLNTARARAFAENKKAIEKMPATVSNRFLEALCSKEEHNVDWIERLNKTCTHQADNLRSLLSYAKENYRVTRYAGSVMDNSNYPPVAGEPW